MTTAPHNPVTHLPKAGLGPRRMERGLRQSRIGLRETTNGVLQIKDGLPRTAPGVLNMKGGLPERKDGHRNTIVNEACCGGRKAGIE